MYLLTPVPITRLSLSTTSVPHPPSTSSALPARNQPVRVKSKLWAHKPSMFGVSEEAAGEEVRAIASSSSADAEYWASMGREEVCLWAQRPRVVLAKVVRTPLSLRQHGENEKILFDGERRIIVTTKGGWVLFYEVSEYKGKRATEEGVYDFAGRTTTDGGTGKPLKAVTLSLVAQRTLGVGEGVLALATFGNDELIVSIQDPPSLLLLPIPSLATATASPPATSPLSAPSTSLLSVPMSLQPSSRSARSRTPSPGPSPFGSPTRSPGGLALATQGDAQVVLLDEWDWIADECPGLVNELAEGEDIAVVDFVPVTSFAQREKEKVQGPYAARRRKEHQDFIMVTSVGSAFFIRYTPPPAPAAHSSTQSVLFDEFAERHQHVMSSAALEGTGGGGRRWKGVCFHDPAAANGTVPLGAHVGRAVKVAVNDKFGLISLGCEDGSVATYNLYPSSLFGTTGRPNSPLSDDEDDDEDDDTLSWEEENARRKKRMAHLRPTFSHTNSLKASLNSTSSELATGQVTAIAWTHDGYCLLLGFSLGFALYSSFGRLLTYSVAGLLSPSSFSSNAGRGLDVDLDGGRGEETFEDAFMRGGVEGLFWSKTGTEATVLVKPPALPKGKAFDEQLFVLPFAKSAVTALHSPDNTQHAFLQMDDRVMVYRGADQPDLSVINPESDVWQHIKLPFSYINLHHPLRFAAISTDARYIAVCGAKGLTHYNAMTGRWRLFDNVNDEACFEVVGGMSWIGSNVLVCGCKDSTDKVMPYSLRLWHRERRLTMVDCASFYPLDSEPLLISVIESSLLVYTADNTFHHFLVNDHPGDQTVSLRACGSIGFEGVVKEPPKVRGISWLIPRSQQRFGDPADDLNVATLIFLIGGSLVLLRPRRAAQAEVKYDMQVLSNRIEFYWAHLSGIGSLENSLWGWDGSKIRVWLGALTIEKMVGSKAYEEVKESLEIPLDFYPLAVLMDKGIIVGVDQETSIRKNLDFALFRIVTTTRLFIHHVLRYHLTRSQMKEAVGFASTYQQLIYFAHALEILLHDVLEDEADALLSSSRAASRASTPTTGRFPNGHSRQATITSRTPVLETVVEFLDHFDEALQVVVGCARKTEAARWEFLFDVVGKPRDLFEKCMEAGFLKVAASYLLVLHNLEPIEQSSKDTVRLLKTAMVEGDWTLCRELLRFLYSLDRTGTILRLALTEGQALPPGWTPRPEDDLLKSPLLRRAVSSPGVLSHVPEEAAALNRSPQFHSFADLDPDPDDDPLELPDSPRPRSTSTGTGGFFGVAQGLGFGSLLGRVGLLPTLPPTERPFGQERSVSAGV